MNDWAETMSIEATSWALRHAPVPEKEPFAHLVLIGLADHADTYGRAAFPSASTLAEYARCSKRTVLAKLQILEKLGLIRRGNQAVANVYPANRRPVVYDLALEVRITPPTPVDNFAETPISGVQEIHPKSSEVKQNEVRGEAEGGLGVKPASHKPYINHPINQGGSSTYVTTSSEPSPVDNSPLPITPIFDEEAPATPSPSTSDVPRPMRCVAHQASEDPPPPCRACKAARERWEEHSMLKLREAERAARERERVGRRAREEALARQRADPEYQAQIEEAKAAARAAAMGRKQ